MSLPSSHSSPVLRIALPQPALAQVPPLQAPAAPPVNVQLVPSTATVPALQTCLARSQLSSAASSGTLESLVATTNDSPPPQPASGRPTSTMRAGRKRSARLTARHSALIGSRLHVSKTALHSSTCCADWSPCCSPWAV